jgi:hypothetical protein
MSRFGLLYNIFVSLAILLSLFIANGLINNLKQKTFQNTQILYYTEEIDENDISGSFTIPNNWINSLVIFSPANIENLISVNLDLKLFDPRTVPDFTIISIYNNTAQNLLVSYLDTYTSLPSYYTGSSFAKLVPPNTGITLQSTIYKFVKPNGFFALGQFIHATPKIYPRMWTFTGYFKFGNDALPNYEYNNNLLNVDFLPLSFNLKILGPVPDPADTEEPIDNLPGEQLSNIVQIPVPIGCDITKVIVKSDGDFDLTSSDQITTIRISFSLNADMSNRDYTGPPGSSTSPIGDGYINISSLITGANLLEANVFNFDEELDLNGNLPIAQNFRRFFDWQLNTQNTILYCQIDVNKAAPLDLKFKLDLELDDNTSNGSAILNDFDWFFNP